MNATNLQSRVLVLTPLSIDDLMRIKNKESDRMEIQLDSETMSESFQAAIIKKINKMNEISEKLHPWYTYWIIVDRATMKGIGLVGFKGSPDENGYSEIGYGMSPNFRRKGLMTEAVNTLMEWARLNSNCKGIIAHALKTNSGSIKVLKNCGFQFVNSEELESVYVHKFI
ncbi:GNAT family N-acetyltransferase [Sporolactobacillus sp. STSJ-5]|uniref:GNAT family N-acetyltransferase n=1 Tax=Sporolactobacillus sp. STSJ-5 TaxID=2965076 RepID=UPI0021033275|nr:GNAT family N-acetyltransferase [Sporolactobacillus sp. STSJ-5]